MCGYYKSCIQHLLQDEELGSYEEFFVKFKNYSYLHCEWATAEKLARGDKRIHMKIKRYKVKQQNSMAFFSELDEEPFNPDYVEVDRVLDMSTGLDQNSGEVRKETLNLHCLYRK